MRNDAHDEINELPSFSAARPDSTPSPSVSYNPKSDTTQAVATAPQSNKAIGILSALSLALVCASGSFAWWSMQRIQQLEQQLVATQESFSRISEDAAGRIKDISGKFTATESSVLNDNEVLKMRLNKIESSAVEAAKQQQISLSEQSTRLSQFNQKLLDLNSGADQLRNAAEQQQQAIELQNNSVKSLQKDLDNRLSVQSEQLSLLEKNHSSQQQQLQQQVEQTKSLQKTTAGLQKSMPSNEDIKRLQQDILILRSEIEQRPAPSSSNPQAPSIADFDAFRAQTNRTISALQEQLRDLQKNAP